VLHGVCYPLSHTFGVVKFKTWIKVDIVQEKLDILYVKLSHFNSSASAGNGGCIFFCYFRFRCGLNVNMAHAIHFIEMLLSILLCSFK
jgi:hypothetical protein